MQDLDALIEQCVAAGVAARIADREAKAFRAQCAERGGITFVDHALLVQLDARVRRLSNAFVLSQGPLARASSPLFHQHLAEVNRRIEDRMREAK